VLLEFVLWKIGNKKGPENEGLVRSLHAFSGRVRSTQSPLEAGSAHSCFAVRICDDVHHRLLIIMSPSYPLIKWASRIHARPHGTLGEVCSGAKHDFGLGCSLLVCMFAWWSA